MVTATIQRPAEFAASFCSFGGQPPLDASREVRGDRENSEKARADPFFLSFFFFSSLQVGAAPAQPREKTGERRHKRPIRVCSSTRERPHLGCGAAFAKRMPAHGGRRSCPERLGA